MMRVYVEPKQLALPQSPTDRSYNYLSRLSNENVEKEFGYLTAETLSTRRGTVYRKTLCELCDDPPPSFPTGGEERGRGSERKKFALQNSKSEILVGLFLFHQGLT